MKKYFLTILIIFTGIFLSGCVPLLYETIKGAMPYEFTVKATPERFQEVTKDVLVEFGYRIEQTCPAYFEGISDIKDYHVYVEWLEEKDNIIGRFSRFRFKIDPLSWAAYSKSDIEVLHPDSEIVKIAKEIKKRLSQE